MRDFDEGARLLREQADRTFRIAGREFKFRAGIEPERFNAYVDLVAGDPNVQPPEEQAILILNSTVEALLVPEHVDVWREVRSATLDNPITNADMHELIAYMVAVQNGRPTQPAPSSGDGGETTSTTSTELSLPVEEPAATA